MNAAYLAAIERAFLGHAGRGLMLSAADVALIDQWDRAGIPLEVVLSGLAAAFERPELVPARVRGLAFARRWVEEAAEVHRIRSAGAGPVGAPGVVVGERPAERLRARLDAAAARAVAEHPGAIALLESLRRRVEGVSVDAAYEVCLGEWLPLLEWAESEGWACLTPEVRQAIEQELDRLLGDERRRADPAHFAQTWEAHRRRLVRERLGLPAVSDLDARA